MDGIIIIIIIIITDDAVHFTFLEMVTRAREITAELPQQKIIFMNQGRVLTNLMIEKRTMFMINHNFDLQPGEVFNPWDKQVVNMRYQFLYRPEYTYIVGFVVLPGFDQINII